MVALLAEAGFTVREDLSDLLPYEMFLVCEKAAPPR